jgi:hypothetical protein
MPPPPMAPQFYNAYNSFQKPQMNSPPSQFNSIKRKYPTQTIIFLDVCYSVNVNNMFSLLIAREALTNESLT